jgi:FkbM family methyltransferase
VVDQLRLRGPVNAALNRFPLVRTLPSGVRYRCRYIDSITAANEIFEDKIYAPGISSELRTFVDLGCNVGQFIAYAADATGRRDLRGIAIDADPQMIDETRWVIAENGLSGVSAIHGLVSTSMPSDKEQDFYVNPCKTRSTAYAAEGPSDRGVWQRTRVRTIDLEALWRESMGEGVRCNLLKIDIEGSEADFVTVDNPFFRRVDSIAMEIHKQVIAPDVLDGRLRELGFRKVAQSFDSPAASVVSYARA